MSASLHEWLTPTAPASAMQAQAAQAYAILRAFGRNPLAMLGALIVAGLVLVAIFAPALAPYSPLGQDLGMRLMPPSAEHWLGTDELGRDILSRILHGARITLLIVVMVAVISAPIGLIVGAVAGYFGGWTDRILMAVTDVFLSLPKLIMALAFVAALGAGLQNAIIAIAVTAWPAYARIARAETLTFRNAEFIAAVELQGAIASADHRGPRPAALPVLHDHPRHARHGGHHPDGCGAGLPRPRRAAAAAGMGRDDLAGAVLHPRPVVGRHDARHCDHRRVARVLLPRRRPPRRPRPAAEGRAVTAPLLELRNLRVSFPGPRGPVEVVRGVSFDLGRERLGIVGESGSGKTLTGRALLRLLKRPARVSVDRLRFDGIDLDALSERGMRAIRGARISMVMQDPRYSLNPVMTIGTQIAEALRAHEALPRGEVEARCIAMLEQVRIADPERVMGLYPHEVSGGMGQRAMIAMMLVPQPDILIADEPTSALDVSIQAQVLDLIEGMIVRNGMGLILISHDLGLVARYCDRVLVMNRGEVVEELPAGRLHDASHAYTRGLLAAMPRMNETRRVLPTLDRDAP